MAILRQGRSIYCGAAVHPVYIAARPQYTLRGRSIYCGAALTLRHRSRLPGQSKLWRNQSAFMRSLKSRSFLEIVFWLLEYLQIKVAIFTQIRKVLVCTTFNR